MADFFNPYASVDRHGAILPHWQQGEAFLFVTWRLGDSLAQTKLQQWSLERQAWMRAHPQPWDSALIKEYRAAFPAKIEHWLDQGAGSCLLRHSVAREVVEQVLHHDANERCELVAYVIMPNHVHLLFRPVSPHLIQNLLQGWKSISARRINQLYHRSGTLWGGGYWDRLIRDFSHFERCLGYILSNPHKARLPRTAFTLFVNEALLESIRAKRIL